MRNSPRLACPLLQSPYGKYVIFIPDGFLARFLVLVKKIAFLYLSSKFSSECRMMLLSAILV